MKIEWLQYLGPIVVAVITVGGGFLVQRLGRKGDRENALIEQIQEERDKVRARLDALEIEMRKLEAEVRRLLTRDAKWDIHATRVEAQVVELGGEPHPRPPELVSESKP